jgi:hypothetical protein
LNTLTSIVPCLKLSTYINSPAEAKKKDKQEESLQQPLNGFFHAIILPNERNPGILVVETDMVKYPLKKLFHNNEHKIYDTVSVLEEFFFNLFVAGAGGKGALFDATKGKGNYGEIGRVAEEVDQDPNAMKYLVFVLDKLQVVLEC